MAGWNGLGIDAASADLIAALAMLMVVVTVAPNSQEWVGFGGEKGERARTALPVPLWRASWPVAAALALAGVVAVASATRFSEFLYYQF
jgi:hypothetical protein